MTKPRSLVEQLQADALEQSVPVTNLLRRAKLAAIKLGQQDLATWVDRETEGYFGVENVPDYRQMPGELKFFNPYRGWCPIFGMKMPPVTCRQSVSEVAALLKGENDFFLRGVPDNLVQTIWRQLGFQADIKIHLSRASFERIVEAVRNTVLDWALRLEQAGVHGEGISFSQDEAKAAQSVTINVGTIGNAVGIGAFGDGANISAAHLVNAGDLAEKVRELLEYIDCQRLPPAVRECADAAINELRSAASEKTPEVGRLRRALSSLQRVVEGAAGNLAAAGIQGMIVSLLAGAPH